MENQETNIKNNENSSVKKKKKKKKKKKEISFENEILRKTIHLLSLLIPIIYTFVDKNTASLILFFLSISAVIVDLSTKLIPAIGRVYFKIFGSMLRHHERKKKKIYLNGASWVLISAFITVFLFPKIIAITALTILVISDLTAALVGRKFGKTNFFDKSLEGSVGFIVSAMIIVFYLGFYFMLPWTYFVFGFLGVTIASILEASSKSLSTDDNLSIPLSVGVILWVGGWLSNMIGLTFIDLL